MAEDIERTIYKLEIDGSAYIEGADKLTNSTNKLSQAQEAANKKLAELNAQQNNYKKSLAEVNAVIAANEKETIDLTKRLNELKAAEQGTSTEAKKLQDQLRAIALNTKEFKVEAAALKTSLTATNTAIKVHTTELKAAEAASGGFTKGLTKAYSGLRDIANIIPGLGISSIVLLIAGPLVDAFEKWANSMTDAEKKAELLKEAFQGFAHGTAEAGNEVDVMREKFALADKGILNKKDVLEEYNKTIGKTLGYQTDYNAAEDAFIANAEIYIKIVGLKAEAQALANIKIKESEKKVSADLNLEDTRNLATKAADLIAARFSLPFFATKEQLDARIKELSDQSRQRFNSNIKIDTQQRIDIISEQQKKVEDEIANLELPFKDLSKTKPASEKATKAAAKKAESDFEKRKADLIAQLSALAATQFETEEKIRQQYADKLAKALLDIENDKTITAKERAQLVLLATQLNYAELEKALTKYNNDKAKIISDAFIKEFDERDAEDKKLLQQQLDAGAASIKAIEDAEKAKYAAMKTPVPKGQGAVKTDKPTDDVAAYADAVGQVAASVIQFWQAVNDAETKQLDYSIALQEKRVTAAQTIADRGNAEYLKQEQDKLTQLNVQRANAARRQLGIDAALQGSQILVGITGAIADLAKGPGGPAKTIADIAIIIGALATGYGLVKSLQGNQPQLFKGTPFLEGPGGVDSIPAHLTRGEAVIPTDKNKAYHPAVEAIYDGTIPAEHLNAFVKNYHHIKGVPQLNYEGIGAAAALHIGHDGRMSVLLEENNDLQRQTIKTLHKLGVNVSLDKNGFAVTQMEVIEKMKRDKRV